MSQCEHQDCWSIESIGEWWRCVICFMEYIQNDGEPLIYRENIMKQFLTGLKFDSNQYFHVLEQDDELSCHVVSSLVNFFCKQNDITLQSILSEGCLLLAQRFGAPVVESVAKTMVQFCLENASRRMYYSLYSLLLELIHHIPALTQSCLQKVFMEHIIKGISFPDDQLRILVIELTFNFVSCWTSSHDSLTPFRGLTNELLNLMSKSDTQQVLTGTMHVLGICAGSPDFLSFINFTTNQPDAEEDKAINCWQKMFTCIKRIFLLRKDTLSLNVINCLQGILNHTELIQPFLDADLAELMYDSLKSTTNDGLILSAFECLILLSQSEEFFTSCHAMYGITSVCKSILIILPLDDPLIICKGYDVLKILLVRQPEQIPLLGSTSTFDQILQVITDGITSKHASVLDHVMATTYSVMRHLPHPIPCKDLVSILHAMELTLPQHFNAMIYASGNENLVENMQFDEEGVFSYLFMFIQESFRAVMGEKQNNQGTDPQQEDFTSILVNSLLVQWIPLVKSYTGALCCLPLMENLFLCLTSALQILNDADYNLWKKIVAEDLIEIALKVNNKQQQIEGCARSSSTHSFLLETSLQFLQQFDFCDERNFLKSGFYNLKGAPNELSHYLSEKAMTSDGKVDQNLLHIQCTVFTVFAIIIWEEKCFVSLDELSAALTRFTLLHPDLSHFPKFSLKFLLLLLSVCQLESLNPTFPTTLITFLVNEDSFYMSHPSFISTALQCPENVVNAKIKLNMITRWISLIDIKDFAYHPGSQLLVGLILLNRAVADVILEGLATNSSQCESHKLILLVTGAVNESAEYSDENNEKDSDFYSLVCKRLPDIINLEWSHITQVPVSHAMSLIALLRVIVSKQSREDGSFLHHRFLRQVLTLVTSAVDSTSDAKDDAIIASCIDVINDILSLRTKPSVQSSELSIVLSNAKFLKCLEKLLGLQLAIESESKLLQLFALLVRFEHQCKENASASITFKAEKLLSYVSFGNHQRIQISTLQLWTSLLQSEFQSSLLHLKPLPASVGQLLCRDDVILAPLNRKAFNGLFMFVLNCSAKCYPGIKEASLSCVIAMLDFARRVQSEVLFDMTSSPWLSFSLGFNEDENPEVTRLARIVKGKMEEVP
ncbi:meiosis inhibitor protein 1-like isoform X2 [Clavelina lepadiformis]|uniref:meiosis inhibitor protein 1-like isoform X2 n=1 Tax=Clavelina lepadiformis TaxID=159417 RepID=UPI004041D455